MTGAAAAAARPTATRSTNIHFLISGRHLDALPHVEPLAARVRSRLATWMAPPFNASTAVLHWISHGIRIPFLRGPPPKFYIPSPPMSAAQRRWVLEVEAPRMFKAGAWEWSTASANDSHVSPHFLVAKKDWIKNETQPWRFILNCVFLNTFVQERKMRYETLEDISRFFRQDDFAFSWDLQDGFHHLSIHPSDRKYFTFDLGFRNPDGSPRLVQATVMPFGYKLSPFHLNKLIRVPIKKWRANGIRASVYVDDGICTAPEPQNNKYFIQTLGFGDRSIFAFFTVS